MTLNLTLLAADPKPAPQRERGAWTPGPWEAIEHPRDFVVKQVVRTFTETRFPVTVARVERAANATLIAAAPELAVELRRVTDLIEGCTEALGLPIEINTALHCARALLERIGG